MNASDELKKRLGERRKNSTKTSDNTTKQSKSMNTTDVLKNRLGQRRAISEFGFDTLSTDLSSMGKTIEGIYNGWQTKETMQNTLSSVKSMYDRLGKYQEYQKAYGGTDLSDVQSWYKSALDDWGTLTDVYGQYKDADAYKKETSRLKELGGMTASDVKAVMDGFKTSDIETKYKTAKQYDDAIKSITKNSMNVRSRSDADKVKVALQKATDTRDNYLKSIGYKSMEDLEKDMTGTRIAHTTVDGQNILWDTLYNQKKYNEDSSALYKEISSMDDFEEYKTKGKNVKNPTYDEADRTISIMGFEPFAKDVENVVEYAFENKEKFKTPNAYGVVADDREYYTHMTSQERDIYNYHLGREKEGLAEKGTADKYLESIYGVLKERYENKYLEGYESYTEEHPVLASALSVYQSLLSGGEWLKDTYDYAKTGELDSSLLAKASSTARGTVSNKVDWEIGNWDAFDFVYNTGMSGIDSATAMMIGGNVGGAVLGLSAAVQGTNDALERGLDNKSAFWSGLSAGVFEGLFETFSIGKFKALKYAPVDGVKSIIKNVGKSMLTNATEETLTELANITYDNLANADLSQANTKIRAYVNSGMSEKEARNKVAREQALQVGEAGLSGAVMGFGFGAVGGGSAYFNNKGEGKRIKENERTSEVFDIASNPEVASAYEAYTNYANKGINADNIKDAQLGSLYISAKQDAMETIKSKDATPEQKASAMGTLGKLAIVDTENTIGKRAKELNVGEETKVTKTGEALEIKGIETSGDETFVVTDNGKISVKDATLTQKDSELVAFAESISKTDGTDVANLFVSQYDGKMDLYEYAKSFNLTMAYAKNNYRYDEILNKKGELTATQVSAIYKEVRIKADKQRQEAIKKLNEKMADGKFYKGFIDDAVIDYSNTSAEGKVNWNDLTSRQREAVTFIKGFAQATGMNLSFVANNPDFNGRYDKTSNTITINLDKGGFDTIKNIEETIIPTMSHETTHWMKDKSPELWRHLNEIVFSTLIDHYNSNATDRIKAFGESAEGITITEKDIINRELNRLINREVKKGVKEEDIDKDALEQEARDEIIARACEDMLKMSNQGRKIFSSLSEAEQKGLVAKIKAIVKDLLTWVDNLLNSYDAKSEEARIMREYKEQLQKAEKVWSEMLKKSVVANQSLEKSGAYSTELANVGLQLDAESNSVAPTMLLSEKTWTESEYVQDRETAIKAIVKALGVTEADARRYVDNINGIARMIADDRARLDYDSNVDEFASVLKTNKEYKWTVDMSTLCAKRLLFTGTFDAIQKKLPNMAFNSEDIVALRSMMMERGYEVACGICYVESTRRELGTITADFIERYKLAQKNGTPISKINSEGKEVILQEKGTKRNFYAEDGYIPTLAELNTTDIDLVKRDHPEVYAAYLSFMKSRGQAIPKLLETRAEYKGEILKHFKSKSAVKARNDAGGLRVQSFSDFEVAHLIDMMQIVLDMSRVGLMSQAYTKVPAFADVFGNTGMKINLSLIAKGSGLDANGNLVFDDVEGMPHEEAFRLRDKYSKNVGTILVGKNDDHIRAALADPRIDFIIPFHKSFWKESLYDALGLQGYEDYTETQNEKPFDKDRKIKNFQPSEYWDYSKSGKENAETYLKMCAEDGRIPKFPEFRKEDGYWKLLIDFKMYDNDGAGSPQMAVKPDFSMDEANAIMNDYEGGHRTFPVAQDVVDDFVKQNEGRKDILYSEKNSGEYTEQARLDALNSVENVRFSEKEIVGESGTNYGMGVYLDSNLLTDLTEDERKKKVEEFVITKLGGKHFLAYDNNNDAIDIRIATKDETIKTNKGKRRNVLKELYRKNNNFVIKHEAVVLIDELIANAKYDTSEESNYPHDWLDNYGQNDWDYWQVYIQEKNKTVWEATLNIANTSNGEKILYDINPIKMVEQAIESATSTTDDILPQDSKVVKELFSEKGDSVYDTMGETERVMKENEKLRADVERLKQRQKLDRTVTHGKVLNNNQLLSVAGYIRKLSHSQIDKVELAKKLKDVYSFINESENLTWEEVYRRCYAVADSVLNEAKSYREVNEYYKEMLSDIKNSRVRLSDSQKAEASHIFGKNWNRHFFGKVIIADKGISLEAQWMEWAEQYPGTFDTDISEADMITALYDIIRSVKDASEVVLEYDATEDRRWVANEIYNQYWNVSAVKTTADRHEQQIKKLNYEHRKAMSELREDYKARITEQKKADRERYTKLAKEIRERKDKEIARAKELGRERLDKYKENAERKTILQSIMSVSLALNKKLKTNSKDVHIPQALKPVVINLLNSIDASSKQLLNTGVPTKMDATTDKALSKVHSMAQEDTSIPSLKRAIQDAIELFENAEKVLNGTSDGKVDNSIVALGDDMIEEIKKLINNMDILMEENHTKFVLHKMSTENLKTLNEMVRRIRHWATVADIALANKKKARINNLSMRTVAENDALGERQDAIEAIEDVKGFFTWSHLLPINAFKRLGSAAMEFFDGLRDAQDKVTFNRQKIMDFTDKLLKQYNHKEVKKWRTDVKTFEVKLPGEDKTTTVAMPVSYIMTLYCVAKQEDAQRHLYGMDKDGNRVTYEDEHGNVHNGGGMTIKGYKASKHSLKMNKSLDNTIVNEGIVKQITSVLTKEQIEVADSLQEYMNTQGSEWGDAVSMALHGIEKFNVDNYFPITVSPHTLSSDKTRDAKASMFSILNYGFTKDRNPDAKQSIEIGDIFDIFANHMNMVAIYNAYALAVYDIARWYNFKGKTDRGAEISVTKSIEKAFGSGATNYVSNLIKDLNGQHEPSRLGLISKIFKNTKVAMVGNSISVALLQPTAYLKAMVKVPSKYLLKSALYIKDFGAKKGVEKAKKYCGIALLKSQGYFETGVSANTTTKLLHDESWWEKRVEGSLKGAGWMDEKTWGVLWNAVEFEVRATRKDLKVGSEEFYNVVAEKLRDVIYETQVVDSPLTKSDLMRSGDTGAKMVTMFASEMTVAYNMVFESAYATHLDAKREGTKSAIKKNWKNIAMTLTAYTLTSMANAALTTLSQAFRDDDDEEKDIDERIKQFWINFGTDWLIIGKIPYFKETISLAQGYSSSRTDTIWLESAFKAYNYFGKAIEGKDGALMKAIDETLKSASYVSGLAMYNQWRELRALLRLIGIID